MVVGIVLVFDCANANDVITGTQLCTLGLFLRHSRTCNVRSLGRILHWKGSSLAAILQFVSIDSSLQRLTLAQTAMQHKSTLPCRSNSTSNLLHFRKSWGSVLNGNTWSAKLLTALEAFLSSRFSRTFPRVVLHTLSKSTLLFEQSRHQLLDNHSRLPLVDFSFLAAITACLAYTAMILRLPSRGYTPLSSPLSEPSLGSKTSLWR